MEVMSLRKSSTDMTTEVNALSVELELKNTAVGGLQLEMESLTTEVIILRQSSTDMTNEVINLRQSSIDMTIQCADQLEELKSLRLESVRHKIG